MYTKFIKTINGVPVIKNRNAISVITKKQIPNHETGELEEHEFKAFGPSNELLFENGWEIYAEPTKDIEDPHISEETIESVKNRKLLEIQKYDSSKEVNVFYVQGAPIWLDKATRSGLKLRFESESVMGLENTTLWYDGFKFALPLKEAIGMLYALEVYASVCYDNTQFHISNVEKMTDIDEIKRYNFRTGYPDKLEF